MKKKVSLILCILTCALLVAGCNVSLTKQNKNFNEKKLEKQTDKSAEVVYNRPQRSGRAVRIRN